MNTIFILSHNSPDKCRTLDTLVRLKYSGRIYIIIDDEDKFVDKYKEKYGKKLIVFNKKYFLLTANSGVERQKTPGCTLTARNAVEEAAKLLKLNHFIVLDDDIIDFKWVQPQHDTKTLKTYDVKNFDEILTDTIDYMVSANIACLSFFTQNLFIGGYEGITSENALKKRTVSNCLIRNMKFSNKQFMCMYEDWCYSLFSNKIGELVFSVPFLKIIVEPQHTQKGNKQSSDGNAELYNIDDYRRNFLPVLAFPNCVTIKTYNNKLTPAMKYENVYPKIVSSKFRNI